MRDTMKRIGLIGLVLFCCLIQKMPVRAQAKNAIQARVTERFEFPFYNEGFDSISKDWPILSNAENLLLIQEGEYILQRKSKLSPFAAMGTLPKEPQEFRLVTSLKLIKGDSEGASMGFIFMAQPGGKGGFIFEIHQDQQYRLRQITPTGYANLTGNPKEGGWVKSSLLKPINFANLIELRIFNQMYDLYLNNKLLLGFNEIAYKSGGIGFIIGPAAIGKVDFINIYTSKNELVSEPPANGVGSAGETDIIALAESIIELKSQLNKIQRENEDLKERIDAFMGSEKEQLKLKADFEQRLSVSDRIIKSKDKTIDSLLMVNQDLQRYKELVKGNDGGDLVITLSKNLKSEKLKADELSKQNQALKDSIASLELQIKNQSGKSNSSSGSKANSAKPENTFVLPKEN